MWPQKFNQIRWTWQFFWDLPQTSSRTSRWQSHCQVGASMTYQNLYLLVKRLEKYRTRLFGFETTWCCYLQICFDSSKTHKIPVSYPVILGIVGPTLSRDPENLVPNESRWYPGNRRWLVTQKGLRCYMEPFGWTWSTPVGEIVGERCFMLNPTGYHSQRGKSKKINSWWILPPAMLFFLDGELC